MSNYLLSLAKKFGRDPEESQATSNAEAPGVAKERIRLGLAAESCGDFVGAAGLYRAAIAAYPGGPEAHRHLGIALQAIGDFGASAVALKEAVALEPGEAATHFNLGLAYLGIGAARDAQAAFRQSLALRPKFPEAWVGLADALEQSGLDAQALTALDCAISQREQYVGALLNAGTLLQKLGQAEAARRRLSAIDLVALFMAGNHTETNWVARQLVQMWPEHGLAWKVLGAVLAIQGQHDEGARACQRALELLPPDAETHHNLALCLQAGRLHAEAETHFRDAIRLRPAYAEAHNNLANTLMSLGRPAEAESQCRRAIELRPTFHQAHSDLGNVLETLGRSSEAVDSLQRALELRPDYAVAQNNLAASLVSLGRLDEAEAHCRRAIALQPGYREAHDNLLFLINYHPDRSLDEVFGEHQAFDAAFGLPLKTQWRAHSNAREPERRLRVGYVSPDFRRHAARHFVEPLFDHHDRSVVEVRAYAEVAREDEVTLRLKDRADAWTDTCGLDDVALAERIREDRIDILVDLAGHTRGNRLPVFARKPAPVSVTTIGYGYTTGLTSIDWFLSDPVVVPAQAEAMFSEGVWRIPLCQVFRPAHDMGPVGPLPAAGSGRITFGSLTRAARMNRRVVRLWSKILLQVPGSRLRIDSLNFRDAKLRQGLADQFCALGVSPERLKFGYHSPPWDVMRSIDVGLDCFPQNSGTTLFESVYMGIPFVTLKDRPSLGRLGASIATHAGHPEWIAESEDEYLAIAVNLASDIPKLAQSRERLRAEMQASPLMDERGYVRAVEAAYRGMWQRWCAK